MINLEVSANNQRLLKRLFDKIGEDCAIVVKEHYAPLDNPVVRVDFPDGFHVMVEVKTEYAFGDDFIDYLADEIKQQRANHLRA